MSVGLLAWLDKRGAVAYGQASAMRCALLPIIAVGTLAPLSAGAQSGEQLKKALEGVGVTERLGERVPPNIELVDADEGRATKIGDIFGAQPVLLSLNYTDCPMLCSLQLAGLARALRKVPRTPGEDFVVLSVSIDPDESLEQAKHSKRRYIAQAAGREGLEPAWRFFVADKANIEALTSAVGFRYRVVPETGEYVHQATLIVLTAEGRVSRYLHGINYPTLELAGAIDLAKRGEIISKEEQAGMIGLLLNCFSFDPTSNSPTALAVMRIGGVITVLALVLLIGVYGFRGRRRANST